MNQPTPGPCGCATTTNGFGYTDIVYCPLHAQAQQMMEFVRKVAWDPIGPTDSTPKAMLDILTGEARAILKELDA